MKMSIMEEYGFAVRFFLGNSAVEDSASDVPGWFGFSGLVGKRYVFLLDFIQARVCMRVF